MPKLIAPFIIAAAIVVCQPAWAQDRTFGGNDCTDECEGHKAGYEWAELNSVTAVSNCSGYSQSFIEGCQTYVEDPTRGSDVDDDGKDIK